MNSPDRDQTGNINNTHSGMLEAEDLDPDEDSDEEEKVTQIVCTPGGNQQMTVITESGFYHAALKSRVGKAKAFRKWVTAEVLPQIRKTGGYIPIGKTDGNGGDTRWRNSGNGGDTRWRNSGNGGDIGNSGDDDDKTILCKALMIYKRTIELKDNLIEAQKPKVEFADAVTASKGCIYIAQLANLLHQNGYETDFTCALLKFRKNRSALLLA